jgi:FlaA1/EpsC-like NDP-sugar epimerase
VVPGGRAGRRSRQGRRNLAGISVLGRWDELAEIAERTAPARDPASAIEDHNVRRRAFQLCETRGSSCWCCLRVDDSSAAARRARADAGTQLRQVELDDLLGRDPVRLDAQGLSQWIAGRTVLVTGAGGSIGSELCRQIARFAPGRLVLFDHDEYAMYRISERFSEDRPEVPIAPVIGDVKDAARLKEVFERWRPQVVFHAAAYKHVPLMETDNAAQRC